MTTQFYQKALGIVLRVLFLITITHVLFGQTPASGDLEQRLKGIIDTMPLVDGDDYSKPSDAQFATWGAVIDDLLTGNYADAATSAATLDYDLIEFEDDDTDRIYYILENNDTNFWGTYVFYPNYVKSLVVQSPHPQKDFNTGRQGAFIFKETEAMFFFLAGTHRCNHTDTVNCSGTTDVCSGSSKFRISDMAHNDSTLFQSTTDTLFRRFDDSYFLQLHGFTKKDSDPYVILSNGSFEEPEDDFIGVFKNYLLQQDNTLTFQVPHENEDWDRLIGRTNTQGRLINGSPDPCGQSATSNSGRFIHMEQEKEKLRANQAGWEKVAGAVEEAFTATLPVELHSFEVRITGDAVELLWQTLTEIDNHRFEVMRSIDGQDWQTIGEVAGAGNSLSVHTYTFTDRRPLHGVSFYRLRQVDFDGLSEYLPVRMCRTTDELAEVLVFPNPASSELHVKTTNGAIRNVRLKNLAGLDVPYQYYQVAQTADGYHLSVPSLANGIYLLVLDGRKTVRVVKKG
ncbi:MAG: T9SS type A sorting domain-containing protein [Bacteroidota bacterium]